MSVEILLTLVIMVIVSMLWPAKWDPAIIIKEWVERSRRDLK